MRRSSARYACARSLFRVVCIAAFVAVAAPAFAQPAVAGGSAHSLILKTDGSVWAVGQNNWGQLGNASITNSEVPVHVVCANNVDCLTNVVAIAAGGTHSMALTSGGRIYVWGWNGLQQLGDSSTNYYETTPQLLSLVWFTEIPAAL